MTEVYILYKSLGYEDQTVLGAYSSKEKLIAAMKEYLKEDLENYKEAGKKYPRDLVMNKEKIEHIETLLTLDGSDFIPYRLSSSKFDFDKPECYKELRCYLIYLKEIDKVYLSGYSSDYDSSDDE